MIVDTQGDLRFICDTIDSNLRYAESKHAAFIAFNGIATFGAFGLMRNLNVSSSAWFTHLVLVMTICLLVCAIITSIYSFMPIIIKEKKASSVCAGNNAPNNALFFEHVKFHSVESYERLLCEHYLVNPENITPLDRCIISQIIANAHLASRKFALFKRAAAFDMVAVVFALGGTMLALF